MIGIKMLNAVRRWREQGRVLNELQSMDDRQLADIGLSRGDIESVASGKYSRRAAA
ncbi:MAG: DUF1127 domain-containing protein [Alphaproteobacteria bacterium]|nr:DUF1127 domain-containing protein [Alphaproteobacteria bacterium]